MENKYSGIPQRRDLYKEDTQQIKIEPALKSMAYFRFNVVTRLPEFKLKSKHAQWKRLDDYTLNSIIRELKKRGFDLRYKSAISDLLASDFAPRVNPICEYFEVIAFEGGNPIEELAATVQLKQKQKQKIPTGAFYKYLKKWMVGAVANVFITEKCANHLCLILAGPQGTFKSTWIRNLCPPALNNYYIEGSLDPDNKDSLLATTTNFIFNLDDYFAGISAKKINEFKGLITKNKVKVRRAYGKYKEERPKICSFVASSNEAHFLHDGTGNRRFLPFEVVKIDIEEALKISIDQAWAQAYSLYQNGFVYWLTEKDNQELSDQIERFEVQSTEYELLITYLRPPNPGEGADAMLTSADIHEYLQKKVSVRLSAYKVGQALVRAGFKKYHKQRNYRRSRVYGVVYTDEADLHMGRLPCDDE